MGIAIGFVLVGLVVFILIRGLVNWLSVQPDQPIIVPPQPKQFGRGRIIR